MKPTPKGVAGLLLSDIPQPGQSNEVFKRKVHADGLKRKKASFLISTACCPPSPARKTILRNAAKNLTRGKRNVLVGKKGGKMVVHGV